MSDVKKTKPFPRFDTDDDAERFVAEADLSEYDFSQFQPMRFEIEAKSASITMRVPASLLKAVKAEAEHRGMPYQRFIRQAIERALTTNKG